MEIIVSLSSSINSSETLIRLLFSLLASKWQILCIFSTQQYMLSALYAIAHPSDCYTGGWVKNGSW